MGFLSDIKAMRAVGRLKAGHKVNLSMSQITNLIINLPDARKNLGKEEFDAIYALFKDFRKCNTKIEMDLDGYVSTAKKIINKFDSIAPYQKYGGGNEMELEFMMDNIRKADLQMDDITNSIKQPEEVDSREREYVSLLVKESFGELTENDAHEFLKIVHCNSNYGKVQALRSFDLLANKLINELGFQATMKVSFMAGLMYSHGIVTKPESDELGKKYTELIIEKMKA